MSVGSRTGSRVGALLQAAHLGPTVAVTTVTLLLAVGQQLPPDRALVVTAAVLCGQLTIGWGNDLVDAARDRTAGRLDKPLANGRLTTQLVQVCLAVAAVLCIGLSFLVGWRSALVHLGLGVSSGHLYNVVLKSTAWSWAPYAVAFGALPAVVTLADVPYHWPPAWMMASAAALGVGAHFLNTLPDFAADAETGVRGLPHRIGAGASRIAATLLLVAASVLAVAGPVGAPSIGAWLALLVVGGLTVVVATARGKAPFHAAIAIAVVDVALLTTAARWS